MNVGGVYTLPLFIACPYIPCRGVYTLGMNIAGVYTLPISISCPDTPCRGVYTPRDEYLRGGHPANSHCVPHTPCRVVYTSGDECWRGVHSSNIHRVPIYPPVEWSIPLVMNIGGVYTVLIFIACCYTPFRVVSPPRDEYWRGVHPSNIHRVPLYPLPRGLYPSR